MDSDWTKLPEHLLDSILKKLVPLPGYYSLSNYWRFCIVCMSWQCVAKSNDKMSSRHQPPMLLISTDQEDTWNIYNVMEGKLVELQLSLPNKRFCGSSKGWLITVEDNFEVTLVNPFSRVKGREVKKNSIIRLPALNPPDRYWVRHFDYYVYKASISADPILNANDCIVVVIYEEGLGLAFIRLTKDTTWTYVNKRKRSIDEVVSIEDKFYAIDGWSKLLSFDFTSRSSVGAKYVNVGAKYVTRGLGQHGNKKRYLVDLGDTKFLMVERYICDTEDEKFMTTQFKVFELNFEESEWIEKNTLGDISLFIGDNSTISVLASNISGCLPNSIYFNYDHHRIWYDPRAPFDFGVYDIKNRRFIEPYNTYPKTLFDMARRPPIWVVPSLQAS